ncbi:MAG TPA: hypothetical protein VMF50_10845 [Candidatus Binataceae bacterium]|nr:hypothetical protein [Candidatus Binataceae bacterium]
MDANGTGKDDRGILQIELESAKNRLAAFLANNQVSTVEIVQIVTETAGVVAVKAPWGDRSMAIQISGDDLVDALNNLQLPERYTAIWHIDSKLLEVIFTAYPIPPEIARRAFTFKHNGRCCECSFGDSSERLLLIAANFWPIGPSTTAFRNLPTFRNYLQARKHKREIPGSRAISFWIRGLQWDDDVVLDLINHLNFYMVYYDALSPQILIHSPKSEAIQPQTRFRDGVFPQSINSKPIQENLLQFWSASNEGDPIRRFLNSYLIIESAAFFYISEEVRRTVKKAVLSPNAADNIEALTDRVLEAVSADKLYLNQKIEALLERCVDPNLIWREFEKNFAFFCETIKFDGGFILKPIVTNTTDAASFGAEAAKWHIGFEKNITSIRNALSHGKEQRSSATITPTAANFARLRCWLSPIAVAAREVMVYRDLA